eukprot:5297876-Prymnesium_polylepis.1
MHIKDSADVRMTSCTLDSNTASVPLYVSDHHAPPTNKPTASYLLPMSGDSAPLLTFSPRNSTPPRSSRSNLVQSSRGALRAQICVYLFLFPATSACGLLSSPPVSPMRELNFSSALHPHLHRGAAARKASYRGFKRLQRRRRDPWGGRP